MKAMLCLIAAFGAALSFAQPAAAQLSPRLVVRTASSAPKIAGKKIVIRATRAASPFLFLLRPADLSADQRDRINAIAEKMGQQTADLTSKLAAIEKQISDKLLAPGALTADDLAPLEAQEAKINEAINKSSIQTVLAIRNVLTPAQLLKVAQVRAKLENLRAQIETLMGPGAGALMGPRPSGMFVLPRS